MASQSGSIVPFPHSEEPIEPRSEIDDLRHALHDRDTLIRQLVGELMRSNQQTREHQRSEVSLSGSVDPAAMHEHKLHLDGTIRQLELQLQSAREELAKRETDLRLSFGRIQELSEQNRLLEKTLQDVHELYRHKFTERLRPVTEKFQSLQTDNDRLRSEVDGMGRKLLAVQEVIAQPLLSDGRSQAVSQAPAGLLTDPALLADGPPPATRSR